MSSTPPLTELEGAALALIKRETALTAYEIKEGFRRSPSSYWSGSAGAVYPMMKRLEGAGLVVSLDESSSRRPRKVFRLTNGGEAALRSWLIDEERAADAGYDPLRTRLPFLVYVERRAARELLDSVEARTREMPAPSEDRHAALVHESWRAMRLAWIAELKCQFG